MFRFVSFESSTNQNSRKRQKFGSIMIRSISQNKNEILFRCIFDFTPTCSSFRNESMNASAFLQKQGWRGKGHSLDQTNRGLKNPLLLAHKIDNSGLGTKKNNFEDQWWLRAWDKPSTTETITSIVRLVIPISDLNKSNLNCSSQRHYEAKRLLDLPCTQISCVQSH